MKNKKSKSKKVKKAKETKEIIKNFDESYMDFQEETEESEIDEDAVIKSGKCTCDGTLWHIKGVWICGHCQKKWGV